MLIAIFQFCSVVIRHSRLQKNYVRVLIYVAVFAKFSNFFRDHKLFCAMQYQWMKPWSKVRP